MITETMTSREIYDNIVNDSHKVLIWMEKCRPKAIQLFKKERRFPNCKCFEYDNPSSRNRYIVYFYVEYSSCVDNPTCGHYCIVFFNSQRYIVNPQLMPYKHTETRDLQPVRSLMVYTYHFFQRYNERFLKKKGLSPNELVACYLSRNRLITPIEVTEKINRNKSKYGDWNQAFKIRDGFCFSCRFLEGKNVEEGDPNKDYISAISIVFTTFISELDQSPEQKMEIAEQNEAVWNRYKKEVLSLSNTTLRLED